MSEEEDREPPAKWQSFAEEVWHTLNLIDVSPYVETKNTGKALDYLPWANAWVRVMECFPESEFEFDEPKFYPNGTGEQWVTIRIRRRESSLERRWWLPYLDYRNQPVADPSSMQINTTRMRVLVKCLAMCGLGTELYSGEDVPDESHDHRPRTSARAAALDGVNVDAVAVEGYVAAINALLPDDLASISHTGNVTKIHYDKLEDWSPITELSIKIMTMGELAIAVADELKSWRRSFMREAVKRHKAKSEGESSEEDAA